MQLLTSTRFDTFLLSLDWNNDEFGPCPFLLLQDHLDRIVAAADRHGWQVSLTYQFLKSTCQTAVLDSQGRNHTLNAFKIRITLSNLGSLQAFATPIKPFQADPTTISSFNPETDPTNFFGDITTIYIDSQPTPTSLFTITKTTERAVYNDARLRTALPLTPSTSADVLMYNMQGLITETSIFNVAFYRSSAWITPATSTGCLPGVFRRWLLQKGRIREDSDSILSKDSILPGECVLLFNGVQGCRLGRIAGIESCFWGL